MALAAALPGFLDYLTISKFVFPPSKVSTLNALPSDQMFLSIFLCFLS